VVANFNETCLYNYDSDTIGIWAVEPTKAQRSEDSYIFRVYTLLFLTYNVYTMILNLKSPLSSDLMR
jgi:hypothetical protein